jgi:hypothetical protein
VVAPMVVVIHEGFDLGFKIARQEVVFQQGKEDQERPVGRFPDARS